jgi:hypothetical protein
MQKPERAGLVSRLVFGSAGKTPEPKKLIFLRKKERRYQAIFLAKPHLMGL